MVEVRGSGYDSVRDLWLRSGLSKTVIERLAEADAFRSLGLDRRDALWTAQELESGGPNSHLPLFDAPHLHDIRTEPDADLPPMPLGEHVANDYNFLRLSLKAHPVALVRDKLDRRCTRRIEELRTLRSEQWVDIAGLVLVRQRPGTAKGVVFMTLEDETGTANGVIWPKTFERFRSIILGSRFVLFSGRVQIESEVIHVIAERLSDLTSTLDILSINSPKIERDSQSGNKKNSILPKGRNFH